VDRRGRQESRGVESGKRPDESSELHLGVVAPI
jgi:hypothetical protein